MTKLDTELQSLTVSYTVHPAIEPARRLIVPVTSPEADLTLVMQRVWELANASKAHIHFIGMCDREAQEPALRRILATMSAMMNYEDITADLEILSGNDLTGNLKAQLRKGDLVICWDDQRIGALQKPLRWFLQSELNIPIYILADTYSQNNTRANWATKISAWIGFIAIIIGFFAFQVEISHVAKNWTISLQVLTTAVEFYLIWVWNNAIK